MKEQYERQVELLIDVLPFVAQSKVFALKGGTAINFFHLDCPRLSVDIDLHYLPVNDRDQALADIATNMLAIAKATEQAFPDTNVKVDSNTFNAVVTRRGTQIKIEPNTVIRGLLLPIERRALSPVLAQKYERSVSLPCIAKLELYAGKLCAALQRQHPRDLYDILLFLRENEFSPDFMDVFIIYLISQGKPIYEELSPNTKDVQALYHNQFVGMAADEIPLDDLINIQSILPTMVLGALEDKHRQFVLGFKRGNPDWSLITHSHAETLPAVRWKQLNLDKMGSSKRQQAFEKLNALFEANPYNSKYAEMTITAEVPMPQSTQEQLAEEIAAALAAKGLLDSEKQHQISQDISTGNLSSEDWSLLLELAQQPSNGDASND